MLTVSSQHDVSAPARGDLLDSPRLEDLARRLGHTLRVSVRRRGSSQHLRDLEKQTRVLADVYRDVAGDVHRGRAISPSAEWLLDNFHLITNEVRSIHTDLPSRYYKRLPRLSQLSARGPTRIEVLARELITHSDGRLDAERQYGFLRAFQSVSPLTMGELWAWPSMLKLTLVAHLAGLAERIHQVREDTARADRCISPLERPDAAPAGPFISGDTSFPFIARMLQRIREYGPQAAPVRAELESWLTAKGLTSEDAIRIEGQREAADQVSMANAITSLRLCSTLDWSRVFESVSQVEQVLRRDPAGIYAQMDFRSRDQYRHVVEDLAGEIAEEQVRVALASVESARQAESNQERGNHVGYYLLGAGRHAFESRLPGRRRVTRRLAQAVLRHAGLVYAGSLFLLTTLFLAVALDYAKSSGGSPHVLVWVGLVTLLPATDLAIALFQWVVARVLPPRRLPRLDLSAGIPESGRTMVIVPTLLASVQVVKELVEHLEVQALGNLDPRIHFALLSDFPDADVQTLPNDAEILRAARDGIHALNTRHAPGRADRFFLFHRERRWNERESRWMGWERKRGKLDEFNRLLRGAADTSFTEVVGDLSVLPSVNYCITLDSDTKLPRDAAKALIGIALHPLNRPVVDPTRRLVTDGYGILQPRVSVTMASAAGSVFARVYAGHTGVDPYTTAVSDTYQDLLGEGIFAGKGLYHVDTFRMTLENRVPENALLSHDLFEGLHARAAFVSDIEVVDDYPATVIAHARRQRRWVRGDWQVLLWLFPWVPVRVGLARNPLSLMGRWKILDNLRRSLMAPSLVALLVAGWMIFPGRPAVWTAGALVVVGSPVALRLLGLPAVLWQRPMAVAVRVLWDDLRTTVAQALLSIMLLVYHAGEMVRAIVVTLIRVLVTQRQLLEWETAASVAARAVGLSRREGLKRFEIEMALSPIVGLALLIVLAPFAPETRVTALPFAVAWILAPLVAYWLSRPVTVARVELSPDERRQLRAWARRTWHYFETLVGPADHWLPPDNFQEAFGARIAHRTSPTNIAMALLATLAAYDLGYVTEEELADRVEGTLDTVESLESHEGHLFNWYDTRTLAPRWPRYVSTVDSGNLAAALLALAAGLEQISPHADRSGRLMEGLADTADGLRSAAIAARIDWPSHGEVLSVFEGVARDIRQVIGGRSQPDLGKRLSDWKHALTGAIDRSRTPPANASEEPDAVAWARSLVGRIGAYSTTSPRPFAKLAALADRSRRLVDQMRFEFLYDRTRHLFAIGYRLSDAEGRGRLDASYYDLLASEARLASFVAISKGDVPQEHWFHLSRLVVSMDGVPTLVSWSATMFEYLMPTLVMRVFPGTLLEETGRRAIRSQVQYGRRRSVPWGVSESAYSAVDRSNTYQYRAFGVPGLGLKRGLGDDLVVAPYATALALPFEAARAIANLEELARLGMEGRFGFFDAIDFSSRTKGDEDGSPASHGQVVRTFMAHHQGMFLVAVTNALFDSPMVARFHADSRVRATELLLQERVPRQAAEAPPRPAEETKTAPLAQAPTLRRFRTPHTFYPHAQFLSNGSYLTVVTNGGGNASRWRDLAVTRWREDRTSDAVGQALYLRDVRSGDQWSAAYQPTCREPDEYVVTLSSHRVVFRRTDFQIETQLDIAVSPEDDAEVWRLSVTNHSDRIRELEVTSYAEVVLGPQADDVAHPAFGKLFVETEYFASSSALVCGRRPRSSQELGAWLFHVLSVEGRTQGPTEWETSRFRFLGRGRTLAQPVALDGRPLSGTTGAVLDPIVSLRQRIRLSPGGFVRLSFTTGAASDREMAIQLAQKYHDRAGASRAFAMALTHHQMWLRNLGITSDVARQYDRLASRVFYLDESLRADPAMRIRNERGQSGLWGHGTSGDLPIVLVRVMNEDDLTLARQALQALEYWRLFGLRADVVILNEHPVNYLDEMQQQLVALIEGGSWSAWKDRPGGVHLMRADGLDAADRVLLESVAAAVLVGDRGDLVHQLDRLTPLPAAPANAHRPPRQVSLEPSRLPAPHVLMANGIGGFSPDGSEYVTVLKGDEETPAPWANILANPHFGTLITTSGSAFTWSENSRENRLTPFANDSVADPTAEAIFVRDQETGEVWGGTPGPMRRPADADWVVRFGAGTAQFERRDSDLRQTLRTFVSSTDPVKISEMTLTNLTDAPRRLQVYAFVQWLLGPPRDGHQRHVVTARDDDTGAILAWNKFREDRRERTAFLWASVPPSSVTGDRLEFLGRHGELTQPRALIDPDPLSGRFGAGWDPCGALQFECVLGAHETRPAWILLGEARSVDEVRALISRYATQERVEHARREVDASWNQLLGAIKVRTPDDSFDLIVNRWLLYQSVSSRLWAKTGFYQPSGAFGFRDQLQDVMALSFTRPDLYRRHLLVCAGRQFIEGDVQHWWDPMTEKGTRTRCSDDLLWLPYAVAHYVRVTGDTAILDEVTPFLQGPELGAEEVESYGLPAHTSQSASLFEHCLRAINRSLVYGIHGLPLIGSGDWNDGMNRVGPAGRGESVWLGWFLHRVLVDFAALTEGRDKETADRYRVEARRLAGALDLAWDGEWYRRAYFDDGSPLGSAQNDECKIDSIAQSWAVLSEAAPHVRAERALDAVRSHLIRRDSQTVLLLAPPFDRGEHDPGYIKEYVPGVRENGGQYTHAALWAVMALASLGYGDEAAELFHMLNPVNRSRDAANMKRYAVEPYVVAGDVYAHPQHSGRGGWTWYTGSAGWMYRVAIESILGLQRCGSTFRVAPCIPSGWPSFDLTWRFGSSCYAIHCDNSARRSSGVSSVTLDGHTVDPDAIPLVDDGRPHRVNVVMGSSGRAASQSAASERTVG